MTSHNIYEDELEQAALEWFEELGYETAFAPDISPGGDYPERSDYSDVILEERLKDALKRINADLPQEALDDAMHQILVPLNPALIDNNRFFQKMVTDGVNATFRANDGRIVSSDCACSCINSIGYNCKSIIRE
jgi:type I restriction enzyme R subunit